MKTIAEKALASWSTERIEYMRDNGSKISVQEKDTKGTVTATHTRVISYRAKHMVKVYIPGPTAKSMMANGLKELKRATVCGEASSVIAIWDSGTTAKLTVMEFISGKMEIDMKVAGLIASSMEKDLTFSRTEIPILATIMRANQMERE